MTFVPSDEQGHASGSPRDDATLPATIDKYVVLSRLGRGGMGEVLLARNQDTGSRVAIKLLLPSFARDPALVRRFQFEARAASESSSDGVVRVYDVGRLPDGTAYLVMEYLIGETLGARLRRRERLPEALPLCWQIASVLSAVHRRGIVHRDLKPDNVMVVPDAEMPGGERIKLLDFGIAKKLEEATCLTRANQSIGTPMYMAPEQWTDAARVTTRADVYALGALMFHLLCGRPPFIGTLHDVYRAALGQAPPRVEALSSGVPPGLADLIGRMLAKAPAERPEMSEVAQELEQLGFRYPGRRGSANIRRAVLSIGAAAVLGGVLWIARAPSPRWHQDPGHPPPSPAPSDLRPPAPPDLAQAPGRAIYRIDTGQHGERVRFLDKDAGPQPDPFCAVAPCELSIPVHPGCTRSIELSLPDHEHREISLSCDRPGRQPCAACSRPLEPIPPLDPDP